jgi:hypothetical protein
MRERAEHLERPAPQATISFAAPALTHADDGTAEVPVLHTQTPPFHEAHAGAVEQPRQQGGRAFHVRRNGLDIFAGENRGNSSAGSWAVQFRHPRQILAQHLFVAREQQGAERLAAGGR